MKITRQQMQEILPSWTSRMDDILHYINVWADAFGVNTPLRMAHFLAQCLHETGGFKYMCELGKVAYFKKYEQGKLGKMLGNTKAGDGAKYRGRGLLMTTGRANYKAYQNSGYCNGNIMDNPELLAGICGAVKSGLWYWWKKGLNKLADKDDLVKITKVINGGANGMEDREKWYGICKKALVG